MEKTVVIPSYHAAAVLSQSANLESCPHRVAAKQLIIGRNACKLHHAEFHHKVINQFLSLRFGKSAFLKVTLNVNIQECGHTAHRHSCPVLSLDSSQITKVQPLHSLLRIFCRLGNIESIKARHFLHPLQRLYLHGYFLAQTNHIVYHALVAKRIKVVLFLLNEKIYSVEGYTTVISHNTATAIGVGESGK